MTPIQKKIRQQQFDALDESRMRLLMGNMLTSSEHAKVKARLLKFAIKYQLSYPVIK